MSNKIKFDFINTIITMESNPIRNTLNKYMNTMRVTAYNMYLCIYRHSHSKKGVVKNGQRPHGYII